MRFGIDEEWAEELGALACFCVCVGGEGGVLKAGGGAEGAPCGRHREFPKEGGRAEGGSES